jgi:membrane protein involved in colicin uptake
VVEQKKIAAEARESVKALEQELATERTKSKEADALKEEIARHKDLLDASMKAEREAKSQVEAAQAQVDSIRGMLNEVKNSVPAGEVEKDLEELSSLAAEGPSTGELEAAATKLTDDMADQKAQLANPRPPDQPDSDQGVAEKATGAAKKAMSAVTGFLTGKGGSDDDAQKGGWRAHNSSRKRGNRAVSRLSSIEREFRALDKNGDGKITLSEYIRTKKKTKKRKGAKGGGRTKRRGTRRKRRTHRRTRRRRRKLGHRRNTRRR